MRTLREIRQDSAVIDVRSAGAAAFLSAPLLAIAVGLPWFGGAFPPLGWVPLVVLPALGSVAYYFVRPRRVALPLDAATSLRLELVEGSEDTEFRLVHLRADREVVVLEHPSFAVVARDIGRIVDGSAVALQSVHLPPAYFRSAGRVGTAELSPVTVSGVPSNAHVRTWRGALGGAAFAALVLGLSLVEAQSPRALLSVALASVGILGVALFGAWLSSTRVWVQVSKERVLVERGAFGRRRKVLEIPRHELHGACLVQVGATPSHVVFATTQGPKVLALIGEPARVVAGAVGRIALGPESRRDGPLMAPATQRAQLADIGFATREASGETRREVRRADRSELFRARS